MHAAGRLLQERYAPISQGGPPRWSRFKPSCSSSRAALGRTVPRAPPPRLPRPGAPTWRGRHGLQAGVGAAVVAAAPVPRALRVSLAARRLAGAGGQRARGRRAAVGSRLSGTASLLGLREEGALAGRGGCCAPRASRWASLSRRVLA